MVDQHTFQVAATCREGEFVVHGMNFHQASSCSPHLVSHKCYTDTSRHTHGIRPHNVWPSDIGSYRYIPINSDNVPRLLVQSVTRLRRRNVLSKLKISRSPGRINHCKCLLQHVV